MDVKTYIESGIIERYVLGHVSPQEKQEVECMSHIYPEIGVELRTIESTIEQLAMKGAVAPPADLKAKIMSKIQTEKQEVPTAKTVEAKIIPMQASSPSSNMYKYAAAASMLLLIGIGSALIYMSNQRSVLDQKLTAKSTELDSLSQQKIQLQQTLVATSMNLQFIKDTETKKIQMAGTATHADMLATVYWNTTSKKVLLEINNLSTPPSDKQFQLWAIVNGQPQDMGVFDMNVASNFLEMNAASDAQAFAITLEPKGGSTAPSLDQMYVLGNV